MIRITKKEMELLLSKGCKWHSDIHKTYSGHTTYYATTKPKVMNILNEVRGGNSND